jgi:hypothetical protein
MSENRSEALLVRVKTPRAGSVALPEAGRGDARGRRRTVAHCRSCMGGSERYRAGQQGLE